MTAIAKNKVNLRNGLEDKIKSLLLMDSIAKANIPDKKSANYDEIDEQILYDEYDFARKHVSCVIDDALKNGILFSNNNDEMQKKIVDLGLIDKVREAAINGNISGGCAILMVTDKTTLNSLASQIGDKEIVKTLNILIKEDFEEVKVNENIYSHDYNKPQFYFYKGQNGKKVKIHASRLVIFNGRKLSKKKFKENKYWHGSVITKEIKKTILAASRANEAISEAVEKLKKEILKLSGWAELMLASESGMSELEDEIRKIFLNIGDKNRAVLDKESNIETLKINLSGYGDVFDRILNYLCGLTDLPRQKLLGNPSGSSLSENAQGDQEMYYDRVSTYQEIVLKPLISRIINFSGAKDNVVIFPSLFQKTDLQKLEEDNQKCEYEHNIVDLTEKIKSVVGEDEGKLFWKENTRMLMKK